MMQQFKKLAIFENGLQTQNENKSKQNAASVGSYDISKPTNTNLQTGLWIFVVNCIISQAGFGYRFLSLEKRVNGWEPVHSKIWVWRNREIEKKPKNISNKNPSIRRTKEHQSWDIGSESCVRNFPEQSRGQFI